MYIENPTHNSEIIVETLVEALSRTTYPKFIESLGYNKEKFNFINQILQDTYGYPEAGMLLNIAKQQYTEKFDDIVNVIGKIIRGYPEYKWFDELNRELSFIIGDTNARSLINEVFRF